MKRQIRRGVFETNSSSMHAVAIMKEGELDFLEVDETINKVRTKFGEYGFGFSVHTDAKTKLSYLVTMLVEIYRSCCSIYDLYQLNDFKMINDAVATTCHCEGVQIDEVIDRATWCDDSWVCNEHEGFLDHASCEEYRSVAEFLEEVQCTVEEFIFHKRVKLVIKHDGFLYQDSDAVSIRGEWMRNNGRCRKKTACEICRRCMS